MRHQTAAQLAMLAYRAAGTGNPHFRKEDEAILTAVDQVEARVLHRLEAAIRELNRGDAA